MDPKRNAPGRELIGVILLTAIFLTGLALSLWMTRQQDATAALLEDAAWEAMSQNWGGARRLSTEARQRWRQGRLLTSAVGDHGPLEEIDAQFSQLEIWSAAAEPVDFATACKALATQIRLIGDAQRLNWQNLL